MSKDRQEWNNLVRTLENELDVPDTEFDMEEMEDLANDGIYYFLGNSDIQDVIDFYVNEIF